MCENDGVEVERWTPARRRQRTREALLDAAAIVFTKRGFQGASLDEIAETAGYTRGAIYKHFADKEELLHEVCVRLNERTFAEFDEVPGVELSFAEYMTNPAAADAVVAHWQDTIERDREFRIVMLEFLLQALRNPELRERAREFGQRNTALIADYLTHHAEDAGEPLPLPAADVAAVFGIASDGFAEAMLINPDAARLFGLLLDLLVRGLNSYAVQHDDQPGPP
jgi:AcrR family transcriptional regulator